MKTYFEHSGSDVAFDLIDFHDDEKDAGIEVTEHAIPPPELARLMAETKLPEVES